MKHLSGRFEIICGSMFSGKTEELIRRVRRAIIAKQAVQVFKPQIDDRYGIEVVKSHDGQNVEAIPVATPEAIIDHIEPETTVVAIDEIQFFSEGIVDVVQQLASSGLRVVAAGLDLDFRGEPFGPMPELLCVAEEVMKLHAICVVCGDLASRTQRLVNNEPAHYEDPIIMVGAQESYEARCRKCHSVPRLQPATETS
ncbi:thymidine kinase [Phototrophicus methaneseepsis]|uniref:Thymidine kinase n=1 Tax=Phototrophicus methaneseepsis TaxID=2710758 RepID=A0A7S8E685_9CHLR|nr:thymidine kinase [Phototrophicus methaneseepsis]QPC81146.1 thymidine kinase [Phototrophicus methaneseepsis]